MNPLKIRTDDEVVELQENHEWILGWQRAGKEAVERAIRNGEILTGVKDQLAHGEFLPWIERVLPFSDRAAEDYMRIYRYRNKTANVADLREARDVAQLEDKRARQEKKSDIRRKVEDGEPPPKDRGDRRIYTKIVEDQEYEDRKEEAVKQKETAAKPKPSSSVQAEKILEDMVRNSSEEHIFTEFDLKRLIGELKIRITAIPEISRRHEVINRIIKSMKQLAIECDRLSISI